MSRAEFCQAAYLAALAGGASPSEAFAAMIKAGEHYEQFGFDNLEN